MNELDMFTLEKERFREDMIALSKIFRVGMLKRK